MWSTLTSFMLLPMFFALLFGLGFFALWVFLCIWVYRDAERRGMNGTLWLIIVLFTHVIGLIIYLVLRESTVPSRMSMPPPFPSASVKYCPHCGNPLSLDSKYCSRCGKEQPA